MSSKSKASFFRQSSWMVIATFAGGLCMTLVHTVTSRMGQDEYATFGALLKFMVLLGIPASALQTIFARQAAATTSETDEDQLRATTRALVGSTFVIGLLCAIGIVAASGTLARLWNVSNPMALYLTALLSLTGLWVPIGKGVLQGKHHFGGLGWLQISDGVGRFTVIFIGVVYLHGKTTTAMLAVLIGQTLTLLIAGWLTRSVWNTKPASAFRWKPWLAEAIPMTLGFGTVLAMYSIDTLFVRGALGSTGQVDLYVAATITGFAIVQFIAPVALVMFARVAQNVARSERTDSLGLTVMMTGAFGILAAIGCTILPKLPLQVIYMNKRQMWDAAPLVPWVAWSLLPLTLANVFVQNILAHRKFRAIPWLVAVPLIYVAILQWQAPTLKEMPFFAAFTRVIQTMGGASLMLCLVGAWFSRDSFSSPGRPTSARATSDKATPRSE